MQPQPIDRRRLEPVCQRGNATAVAEFNVWHDPEAAAIVFGCDAPVTMYGLDVFYGATASPAQTAELAASADPGDLALATLAALQGGLLLAQVQRNTRPLEVALDAMLERIQALTEAAGTEAA